MKFLFMLFLGLLFVMGINMAGSEGPWFPFLNIAGVLMLAAFAVMCNRYLPKK